MISETFRKKPGLWTGIALTALCVGGLALRFSLAPQKGFEFDVGTNQGWAKSAVMLGLGKSYSEQTDGNMLPNYPPFSLLVFASTGYAYKTFFSPEYEKDTLTNRILIKTPSIIADILTVLLLYFIIRKWKGRKEGLIAAAVYAIHPAVFYNSAVWGQTDALYTMFLVACLGALAMRWHEAAGAFIALAFLTKMQAIMLVPLVGFVLLLRGWKPLVLALCAAIVTSVLVLIPFVPDNGLKGIWNMYADSVGYYPTFSSNAYNFWWGLFSDNAGSTTNDKMLFDVISGRNAGLVLFAIAYACMLFRIWTHRKFPKTPGQDIPLLFYCSAVIAYSFFLFNTEMHERYLFPFVALATPLVFLSKKAAWLYAGTTFLFLWNLFGVLPAFDWMDRKAFDTFPALDVFLANMLTFLFPMFFLLYRQLPHWNAPTKGIFRRSTAWLRRPWRRSSSARPTP